MRRKSLTRLGQLIRFVSGRRLHRQRQENVSRLQAGFSHLLDLRFVGDLEKMGGPLLIVFSSILHFHPRVLDIDNRKLLAGNAKVLR